MTDKPSPRRQEWLRQRQRSRRRVRLWQAGLLAALLGLWQLTTAVGLSDGFLISSPSRMWGTLVGLCRGGELLRHVWVSCLETVVGFLAGTLLGTAIAICMWWREGVARVLSPYLVVLNALPKTALGPIFIVWMGAGMVNQYETQAMEQELRRRGHELVDFEDSADAYIINTCSVTAVSDKKSRQMIRRARRRSPGAVVAACGCYVQTHTDEAKTLGIDLIGGTGDRMAFLDLLEQEVRDRTPRVAVDDSLRRRSFEVLPAGGLAARTRAMLKVEDGCVNFCTYCIIPFARGPVRSLPMDQAVAQTRQLQAEGYRELVFTGIEISSWGQDLRNGTGLIDLMEAVAAAAPRLRLRLGSLEPRTITEDFCHRAAALPNLCPHFHLSLQSGCDTTLHRMNRRYDTARFRQSVDLLRRYFDHPAITTDVICGFPQETEEEFSATLAFLEECRFAAMHVFPYSIRPGTKAADMPQVPGPVKEERAARAGALAARLHRAYLEECVGRTYPVLFEQPVAGRYGGHAPNYMEVAVPGGENLHNQVLPVRITGTDGEILWGELE